jgi:Ni/Co efflux regulator RcnB
MEVGMREFLVAALAAALAAVIPGSLCAQPHPEGGHPAVRPAPAMHAPTPQYHMTAHRATTHYYHRPTTHRVTHHVYHRHVTVRAHHVVHHVGHVTHVSARVAGLRRNVTAAHRFHAGVYRAPAGYHYQRWSYGAFLPAIYWGRDFWITDFLAFGLFAPPDGYIWVRYGPDALLIDQYTGEIIQVDYGVFY